MAHNIQHVFINNNIPVVAQENPPPPPQPQPQPQPPQAQQQHHQNHQRQNPRNPDYIARVTQAANSTLSINQARLAFNVSYSAVKKLRGEWRQALMKKIVVVILVLAAILFATFRRRILLVFFMVMAVITTAKGSCSMNCQACGDTNGTCVFKSGGTCVELPWPTDIPIDRIQCLRLPEVKTCDTAKCTDFCESFFESKDKSCSGKCEMQNRPRAKQAAPWLEEVVKMCKKDVNCGQCTTEKTPGDSVSGKPGPGNGTGEQSPVTNADNAGIENNQVTPKCPNCSDKLPIWAIIVIAVLGLLLLIAVAVAILMQKRLNAVPATTAMVQKPFESNSAGSIKDGDRGKTVVCKGARSVVGDDRNADQDDQNIGVSMKRETAEKSSAEEPIKNAGYKKSNEVKSGDEVKSTRLCKGQDGRGGQKLKKV